MCPPVNVYHADKGMSQLCEAWLYQLVHEEEVICFACFKAGFLLVKNMVEMGEWEEEWGGAPMELSEAGPEPEECMELEPALPQSHEYCPQAASECGGSKNLIPSPVAMAPQPVPTELGPQEAVPLDLDPEDAEWTQAFPWRLYIFDDCHHKLIIPPMSWWDVFNVGPFHGQPVLLELSPIWPMVPWEAEAWLIDLKFFLLLNSFDAILYLLSMTPVWAVRTRVKRWQVLLDPGELTLVQLQNAPEQQDLDRWKLSILESSDPEVELVPADYSLRKGGFKVHSYLPWHNSTPEVWSREPGEGLPVREVPCNCNLSDSDSLDLESNEGIDA
ncbi:testis-expressed protein 19.2-like isoform X1 [Peromyscus eremicus]|uniref:testis-expressed protein 19.2-like isoform X1 n=1 Tax=Peromyscus eremicus TaxID=42410 RepID=UPI0027DDEB6D|nr:testis-expressed protein 19.2-like isoform X1 [Peromyscus eremicus]